MAEAQGSRGPDRGQGQPGKLDCATSGPGLDEDWGLKLSPPHRRHQDRVATADGPHPRARSATLERPSQEPFDGLQARATRQPPRGPAPYPADPELRQLLRVRGTLDGAEREFGVALGKAAEAKHAFRAGDQVEGKGVPVADTRLETADLYRASGLKVVARAPEVLAAPPPYLGIPPSLGVYQGRRNSRMAGHLPRRCPSQSPPRKTSYRATSSCFDRQWASMPFHPWPRKLCPQTGHWRGPPSGVPAEQQRQDCPARSLPGALTAFVGELTTRW